MNIEINIDENDLNKDGIRRLFLSVLSLTYAAEVQDPANSKFADVHELLHDSRLWWVDEQDQPDYRQAAIEIGRAYKELTGEGSLCAKARSFPYREDYQDLAIDDEAQDDDSDE